MRGSIRTVVGFLIVFGAVGGLDNAADSELFLLAAIASVGMMIMFSGVKGLKSE
jgi:hypothetical protein